MKILLILQFHEWNYLTMQRQFDLQSKCLFWFNFFFGEGEVKVRSELEDRFVDQKKKPKKKKKEEK